MPIPFAPRYTISPKIAKGLMRIEAVKGKVASLPVTPLVLRSLRETARLYTTHYSTQIEGNRLSIEEIDEVVQHKGHFPGRERDAQEVTGYYEALLQVEQWAAKGGKITENQVQRLHALVLSKGTTSPYREGQNVIRDGMTRAIVYLPPEAKDVPPLMKSLLDWIDREKDLPCPLVAAIAHYQFATIHPYYDGNGRTARLLTTLILYLGGYDMKGIYSLEEYYARNLGAYYDAISVEEFPNYYMGRATEDITKWVEYFIEGMAFSLERILQHMSQETGQKDQSERLKTLDPKQRKVLEVFRISPVATSGQIGAVFGYRPRTSAALCARWVREGFLVVVDASNKGRKYRLADESLL